MKNTKIIFVLIMLTSVLICATSCIQDSYGVPEISGTEVLPDYEHSGNDEPSKIPDDTTTIPSDNTPLDRIDEMNGDILVNREKLYGYSPSVDGFNGVVLLPLIPIADKLGIEVIWDSENDMAIIDGELKIWIDKDYYTINETEPVQFGPAPQIIDNEIYVPIHFFGYALTGYEARLSEGTIVVFTKSEPITDREVEEAFVEVYLSVGTLTDYRINSIENVDNYALPLIGTTGVWAVSFDVLPIEGYDNWIAGNGHYGEDGWIVEKGIYVYVIKTYGVVYLEVLGTGL